jgi:hypothetical protein
MTEEHQPSQHPEKREALPDSFRAESAPASSDQASSDDEALEEGQAAVSEEAPISSWENASASDDSDDWSDATEEIPHDALQPLPPGPIELHLPPLIPSLAGAEEPPPLIPRRPTSLLELPSLDSQRHDPHDVVTRLRMELAEIEQAGGGSRAEERSVATVKPTGAPVRYAIGAVALILIALIALGASYIFQTSGAMTTGQGQRAGAAATTVSGLVPSVSPLGQNTSATTTTVTGAASAATPTQPNPTAATASSLAALAPGVRYASDWSDGLNGWPSAFGWSAGNSLLRNDGSDFGDDNWLGGLWNKHVAAAPFVIPADLHDYALEAEIRVTRRPECGSFGVVVRGAYEVGVHDCARIGAPFVSIRSSAPKLLADERFSATFDPSATFHLYRVEVQGSSVRTFVDGTLISEVEGDATAEAGTVGLWNDHTELEVRALRVRELAP